MGSPIHEANLNASSQPQFIALYSITRRNTAGTGNTRHPSGNPRKINTVNDIIIAPETDANDLSGKKQPVMKMRQP
jgi:hypothetical protein